MIRTLARAYQGLVFLLLYLPIAVLVAFSFNDSRSSLTWRGFTTDWYVKLIEDGVGTDFDTESANAFIAMMKSWDARVAVVDDK